MKVFMLLGETEDYDGDEVLGCFTSVEQVLEYVKGKNFWYDRMGYVACELGQPCVDRRISINFKRG